VPATGTTQDHASAPASVTLANIDALSIHQLAVQHEDTQPRSALALINAANVRIRDLTMTTAAAPTALPVIIVEGGRPPSLADVQGPTGATISGPRPTGAGPTPAGAGR
jgi:hypothetical protein